jgi:release factor glutamine methyltransferase
VAAAWRRERPDSFFEALKAAREMLSASPALVAKGSIEAEAEQLVIAAFRQAGGPALTRMELFGRVRDRYPEEAGKRLLELAGTRAEGKPLQHLTGYQIFLDHEYAVGPDVLVPRPETELLVTLAIETLKRETRVPAQGIEIGLGSGVISIELLAEFSTLTMSATELTPEAAARARVNARKILGSQSNRLTVMPVGDALDVWGPFVSGFAGAPADFVISNPPYLAASDPIEDEVRDFEPATALFAPPSDPLHFYRQLALYAEKYVRPGGFAFLEVAPERAQECLKLFSESGWEAKVLPDLTGRDRVLIASLNGKR